MQSISHTNVQPNNKKQSKMAPRVRPTVPFLEKLGTATTKKECGMYLFEGFLSPREAKDAFDVLVDDAKFPWDTKPELNGEPLSQQACEHDLLESAKEQKKKNGRIKYNSNMKGLLKLGELFARIERDFDIKVNCVCCNRFPSLENQHEWQKNSYGERFCVLTLGSKRRIEIRNNKTQFIEIMTPSAGDLYVMPMKLNDTHIHRVCSVNDTVPIESDADALLSLVFFFDAPKYAKDFGATKKNKTLGIMKQGRPQHMRTMKSEIKN